MGESEIKPPWNSWEDLILVCLVQRHGLESWETISMEIKSRVVHNQAQSCPPEFFTPQECMHRFPILHQRFLATRETSVDDGDFEKMIKSMKDEYTKIRKETLKQELETHEMNIKLLKQKLERLERENEKGENLKTIANEVVVEANEVGDDEPSLKIDGCDDQPSRVDEANEFDQFGARDYNLRSCKPKMNKMIMNRVLSKLQRHKSSKNFYRKLQCQKMTESYIRTIRQHMDLDLIQYMVNQDIEEYSFHTFFRDLLLLFNNALVFFEKGSQEHNVALQLRKEVKEEMEKIISNPIS